ncbi:MAG TPA: creatininase family protein [Bdellovibrionota bacterium]|nr:creatininase family protein [Bdellovibrionota bacterium]
MPLELATLSDTQIRTLEPDKTLFLFAAGVFEGHGPHLPVGLDFLEAGELARRVAKGIERKAKGWNVVLLPPAPVGVDTASGGGLRLAIRAHVVRDWLVDTCRGLCRVGFRNFACVSGGLGPRQMSAIEEAGTLLARRYRFSFRKGSKPRLFSLSALFVTKADVLRGPLIPEPLEHGGARDTSVALQIAPDSVEASYKGLSFAEKTGRGMLWRVSENRRVGPSAYWGDPSKASAAEGDRELDREADKIVEELVPALLSGEAPSRKFRTAYSYLPPNRSFFLAWMLFVAMLAVMVAWMAIFVGGFTGGE